MNNILSSTKFVVKEAKQVKINQKKIREFCKNFSSSHINHWLNQSPYDLSQFSEKEKLHFLLVFNAISFSYWGMPKWTITYKGENFDGAFGIIAALGKANEDGMPITYMKWLAKITNKNFEKITKGNTKIPLQEKRLKILREIGSITTQKLNGDFRNLIKKAKGDVQNLLELIIAYYPSFEDSSIYKGKRICFYKRAQLLVADIYKIFDGKGYGRFNNIDQLTACADYKLPQVLRKLSILQYSVSVTKKVDNKIPLQKGSEEEIEIRASTIWAVELIKKQLIKQIPQIKSTHINDHLWLLTQQKSPTDKPYHLTRTTAY